MPKIVDTKKRADEIAGAVYTILCTEGLPAVTLARVAEETGLAIGSIRHYFPTHQLLVESALTHLITTISERIYRHYDLITNRSKKNETDQVVKILEELLPFDNYRHQEAILLLRIMNEAIHNKIYRPYAAKISRGMREMVAQILSTTLKITSSDMEPKVEGLSAFIDGLTVAMLAPDSKVTPSHAHSLLTRAVITTISTKQIGRTS
jgi:AcrR family transcriptional regulator